MKAPVRFFCPQCKQTMKIGQQMFGRTVVCPQCSTRIEVPFESDPKAEELYRLMKEKRGKAKDGSGQPDKGAVSPSVAETPVLKNQAGPARKESGGPDIGTADDYEFDRVIEDFWATVHVEDLLPENANESGPVGPMQRTSSGADTDTSGSGCRWIRMGLPVLALLTVMILSSFFLGIVFHRFFVLNYFARATSESTEATAQVFVAGKLYYQNILGKRTPDADAVVILLPQDYAPPTAVSSRGLGPNDERFDPNGESVTQIEEFGGIYHRTGADGSFSVSANIGGRYFVLLISSHEKRDLMEIDPNTISDLRRFFRNPTELIGEYCFSLDEYDLGPGTHQIRHVFSK